MVIYTDIPDFFVYSSAIECSPLILSFGKHVLPVEGGRPFHPFWGDARDKRGLCMSKKIPCPILPSAFSLALLPESFLGDLGVEHSRFKVVAGIRHYPTFLSE